MRCKMRKGWKMQFQSSRNQVNYLILSNKSFKYLKLVIIVPLNHLFSKSNSTYALDHCSFDVVSGHFNDSVALLLTLWIINPPFKVQYLETKYCSKWELINAQQREDISPFTQSNCSQLSYIKGAFLLFPSQPIHSIFWKIFLLHCILKEITIFPKI